MKQHVIGCRIVAEYQMSLFMFFLLVGYKFEVIIGNFLRWSMKWRDESFS